MEKIKRIEPGPGQESVWDYPRPPRVEDTNMHIQVIFNDVVIADTRRAKRVLETGHPPVYYIPPQDVRREYLVPRHSTSFCEWKGTAHYYGLFVEEKQLPIAGWYYLDPYPGFEEIRNYIAFYAESMDACMVDGERARPQPGGFYGGWITSHVVGPFKGEEDT